MFKVIESDEEFEAASAAGLLWINSSTRTAVSRYVVVRDREHAKVAVESGMLFWVNWPSKGRVGAHWLPQSKADAEFDMHLECGSWGILVENDEEGDSPTANVESGG